jgi:FtsH-binding integral membrane protein
MLPREQYTNIPEEIIGRFEFKHTWVNWVHLLVVGPLLVFISLKGQKTPKAVFCLLVLLALAVIGFHIYLLVMKYQAKSVPVEGFQGACPLGSYTCA